MDPSGNQSVANTVHFHFEWGHGHTFFGKWPKLSHVLFGASSLMILMVIKMFKNHSKYVPQPCRLQNYNWGVQWQRLLISLQKTLIGCSQVPDDNESDQNE